MTTRSLIVSFHASISIGRKSNILSVHFFVCVCGSNCLSKILSASVTQQPYSIFIQRLFLSLISCSKCRQHATLKYNELNEGRKKKHANDLETKRDGTFPQKKKKKEKIYTMTSTTTGIIIFTFHIHSMQIQREKLCRMLEGLCC